MRYEHDHAAKPQPKWRARVLGATLAGLVCVLAYLTAAVTLPMAAVALAGHETEVRVTAGKQSFAVREVCRDPVNLSYPHFLFNKLCGVPSEVRQTIHRDDPLMLEGYGNGLGVYYRRVSNAG